jgi:hypothetical protein
MVSSIIAIVTLFVIYWKVTYIDNTVTEGHAYGFQIGDSKELTYEKARKVYTGEDVYILYPLDSNDFGPHKKITFNDNEYDMVVNRDHWEIYFNNEYRDFIKLSFRNKLLISIYRHRQIFELT